MRPDVSIPQQEDGNRIVISGMSGLYPQSHNVKEFSDILYNKINPVTNEDLRFNYYHPEVVQHTGSVPDLPYFDAQFFKVHYRLSNTMDPMAKKVLEQTYTAIHDAGVNPDQLSGKKVGSGCSRAMFANRISYWLNAKGPSMSIDEACCSSTAALEQAYLALSRGECEAAIITGTFLCLHPQSSVHYGRIIKMCNDGKTKSFDENANGCAKSEAINALFLQKAKDALRIYAEVLYVKSEFTDTMKTETGPKYGFYRNLSSTTNFIKKFYDEAGVPPEAIEYVEAFGSAQPEADKVELEAIEEVFCKNRNDPLFIGSVMSNIGYGEAAYGISAITKVLLGYHNGALAANLHFEKPRQDIAALREGRMRVITEHHKFGRTYVGVNGMSVTGVNSHVLLHGCYKPKDLSRYKTNIPYLVTVSGRHDEAVKYILEDLKSNPIDPEQLALLNNIHRTSVTGHLGRGFTILQTNKDQKTISLHENVDYFNNARRPLWFVYSGMGSQWVSMGEQLMCIPIFAAAIERCRKVLETKGLDVVHIITSHDENIFNNILHSFVGIAAIQIGLTDILHELGLKPDGIIGHSVGELGCAYADGCLTTEEMILSAYYRGLVSVETKFIRGSMAAVGMGYEQISQICPPEIAVACHNGPESSTISGPADIMRGFVADLTSKGIFAKEVPCSNIAYHSRYIADAGPGLLKYLQDVIRTPKQRTERWLSSSVPQEKWNESSAKYCSAEYLTNNLLNSVLFEEASRLVPKNAVLVEIAPHGLLQAILRRSMPADCKNIPLTKRKHPNNTVLLLEAIGKLYMEGYDCDVQVLYPKVEMPVSTGTPFLSHLVKWAHDEEWPLVLYSSADRIVASNCNYVLALHDQEHKYLAGNFIRGNTLYPFSASLTLVWDVLTMIMNVPRKQLSVEFSYVQLYSQPVLHERRQLYLNVTIQRGTGKFEILDGRSKVVTGFIKPLNESKTECVENDLKKNMCFSAADIYQLLRDRDYFYSGEFQSIACVDESLSNGMLSWRNNWVTFIDSILQLNVLRQSHHSVSQPNSIRSITIDVDLHSKSVLKSKVCEDNVLMWAQISDEFENTRCGGVIMESIRFQHLSPDNTTKLSLKSSNFVYNFQSMLDISSSLQVFLQIVAENVNKEVITAVGIRNQANKGSIFKEINDVIKNLYKIKVNYKQITLEMAMDSYEFGNEDLILVQNLSTDENVRERLKSVLQQDNFVVNEENSPSSKQLSSVCRVVSIHQKKEDQLELQLLRWGPVSSRKMTTTVSVRNETDLDFLASVRNNLTIDHHLLVISTYPSPTGLKELISSWRKEPVRNNVKMVTIDSTSTDGLEEQLRNIELAYNHVANGKLGGEYYLPVKQSPKRSQNATLQAVQFGDYNSLKWVKASELTGPGVTVNVHYTGITLNDTKQANGSLLFKQHVPNYYGMDFSGITESFEPVMGIVQSGAASTQVRAQPDLLWPVPAHWNLEDAATVPLAYVQAFYILGIKAGIPRGRTIFVHGGAGALGQAIISIALALDCQVFTTVSDIRKKQFLQKIFPALEADNIGCSRNCSFKEMVQVATKEKGCDIVISCVTGNLKDESFNCTAFGGLFYDISQLQNRDEYNFGMFHLNNERNYFSLDFSTIFEPKNKETLKAIHVMVSEGIALGYVRPLSRVTYAPNDVARAFRVLNASSHRGRVLLRMKGHIIETQQRLSCSAYRSNLILCSGSPFGLQLAERLVARGAKQLYLHVNKLNESAYVQHKIRSWRKLGVNVVISSAPLNSQQAVASLLTSVLRQGPLEGVYIDAGENRTDVDHDLISNLDSEIRISCPDICYFTVICFDDNSNGQNVCLSRARQSLPATMVTLPEMDNESYGSYVNWRCAVDAVENALQSTHGVVLAHGCKQKPSLLKQIATLTDISIPENAAKSLTLEELGVPNHKLQSLCTFLRVQYNLTFDQEEVLSLTIQSILEAEKKIIDFTYEDIKGLNTFFNYVGPDELLATNEFVFLPTLVNIASMRDDEFQQDQINICIVPGIEGHHERFRLFCERLKLSAIVLQPGLDYPHETVRETAQRFTEVLLKKLGVNNRFYLLGYESGIFVALEVAAILEDLGLTGKVFCVGCTPEDLKHEFKEQLSEFKDEKQLQDAVLRHMYTLLTGDDASELDVALANITKWSLKVETCVRTLLGRVSHSAQYARALIECALARITQMRDFNFVPRPLQSQIILIRCATGHATQHDTVLQHVSKQPLVVHNLDTPLAHVITDLRCAAIVNEHLDPAILAAFANRNICDTYLMNACAFMTINYKKKN
ncbi:unnamed protein product [Arctia plantaginis]|uniref:Ketosynthase family 3 (KS3) domain-containing protein n=1 Tax=Arctia plantaginis TaxID=874455 RepID=A0A8S1AJK2_ARCPL|nr:unnamed protein product [Arctia plantaginis]